MARADGKTLFANFSGGNWTLDSDVNGALQSTQDSNGNFLGFTYLNERGETETYDGNGTLLTIADRNGFTQTITHNANAQVASVTDAFGRTLQFAYDTNGRISQLTQSDGGSITFAYDSNNNLQTVTYPDGKSVQYGYGAAAQTSGASLPNALTSVTDENASVFSTTSYDAQGRAIGNYHGNNVASYTINYTGGTTVTTPLGSVETASFQPVVGVNRITQLVETCSGCNSRTTGYSYATNGNVGTATDPNGNITAYGYNSIGLENLRTEAQGTSSQRTIQTDWDTTLRVPTERRTYDTTGTNLVAKTHRTYNTRGQVTTETQTDPVTSATRTTTTAYCESADVAAPNTTCPILGLVKSVTGPRTDITTDVTTFTYYPTNASNCATAPTLCTYRMGDLWKITNALGQVTTFLTYDGAGRPLSKTDANGVETDMTFSPRGWLTQRAVRAINGQVSTGDQITGYAYDNAGQVTRVTQPDGTYANFTYDGAHRLTDVADRAGDDIHYTLDAAGNRTEDDSKDPSGTVKRSVLRLFNALSQLQTAENYNQTVNASYGYDANGNRTAVTDGRGNVTNSSYDALNRLSLVVQDPGASPPHIAANVGRTYDALDRLTQVTDPQGLQTQYQYDGLGNQTQLTSPDTGVAKSTFDAAGNALTRTDARGITATYAYDALNRVTGITYPNTAYNVTFTYDTTQNACNKTTQIFGKGRLTYIHDASGSTQLCYDRFGNLALKYQIIGGVAFTTKYAYDLAGHLTQITTPKSTLIQYTRDAAGRITGVSYELSGQTAFTPVVSNVTYYPYGPVASITYGSGANSRTLTRIYDKDYVVGSVIDTTAGKTDGLSLTFGRDVIGNLTQVSTPNGSSSVGNAFVYDALNRLTTVNDLNNSLIAAYAYDGTGNRTSKQVGGTTVPYSYALANHRLAAVGSIPRSYDADGNTTLINTGTATRQGFLYDNTGRLSQLNVGGLAKDVYRTNALGQRVEKLPSGNTAANQYTVYDESGHVLGDYNYVASPLSTPAIRELIWMDDLPVGVLNGTTPALSYIEPDHLGTPRVAVDAASNKAVWQWSLINDPFGESAPQNFNGSTLTLNQRLPGQVWDAESGLSYNYFRDYDSATGRYAESDPIGLGGGISTYAYVQARPLNDFDPKGQVKWTGQYYTWSIGRDPVGGATFVFTLTSDCVDGKQAMVRVDSKGWGLGVGWPISNTGGSVSFDDGLSFIYPWVFEGTFTATTGGVAYGIGFGCSEYSSGGANSGRSCGPSAGGEFGAGHIQGTSSLDWWTEWDCKKCDKSGGGGSGGGGW